MNSAATVFNPAHHGSMKTDPWWSGAGIILTQGQCPLATDTWSDPSLTPPPPLELDHRHTPSPQAVPRGPQGPWWSPLPPPSPPPWRLLTIKSMLWCCACVQHGIDGVWDVRQKEGRSGEGVSHWGALIHMGLGWANPWANHWANLWANH